MHLQLIFLQWWYRYFIYMVQVWDVGLCVDKLQAKVRKKRELRLGIGPEEPVPDSTYASLLFRHTRGLVNMKYLRVFAF